MTTKKRICVSLSKHVYDILVACCKEGKLSKSEYVEMALNHVLNFDLLKKKV